MVKDLLTTLVMLGVAASTGRAGDDADKTVAAALKKAAAAESFTLKIVEDKADPVEVHYQKGQPVHIKAEKIELFKKGDALVYREGDKWMKSRTGTLSDPLRVLGAVAKARTVRLPGDDLAGLEGKIKNLKKGDGMIFQGDLTDAGVQALVRTEHKGVAKAGKIFIELNKNGDLVQYGVEIRLQGRIGNAEIDGTSSRRVTLTGVGATKVEVPEAASKAFD